MSVSSKFVLIWMERFCCVCWLWCNWLNQNACARGERMCRAGAAQTKVRELLTLCEWVCACDRIETSMCQTVSVHLSIHIYYHEQLISLIVFFRHEQSQKSAQSFRFSLYVLVHQLNSFQIDRFWNHDGKEIDDGKLLGASRFSWFAMQCRFVDGPLVQLLFICFMLRLWFVFI